MLTIRCTAKLLARLDADRSAPALPSTTILGDWYATLVHTRRGQFVLAMARRTLLPIVVTGRDLRAFPSRVTSSLAEVLAVYGVPVDVIERECAAMSDTRYAKSDSRSNVGVLTEFQRLLPDHLDDVPAVTLVQVSLRLAETPIVSRHVFPDEETCRLFDVPVPRARLLE